MGQLVSIIVPIYKVEKYLEKCVVSILSQSYQNIEVILVDDGSPDKCGAMCDEFALKDKRIKIIHPNAYFGSPNQLIFLSKIPILVPK